MPWGRRFGPDDGLQMSGGPRDPHSFLRAPRQAFDSLFNRQSRRPSARASHIPANDRERLHHLEHEIHHPHQPGWRERNAQPGYAQEARQSGRGRSTHAAFDHTPQHTRRDQSLHPGFDRGDRQSRRDESFHPRFGGESSRPHSHRQQSSSRPPSEGSVRRLRRGSNGHIRFETPSETARYFRRRSTHVHFEEPLERTQPFRPRSHSEAPDIGRGGLNAGGFAEEPQRRQSMRNAHTDARFNVNFARQPEPQAMPRRRQSFGGEGTGFGRRHQSEFTPRQAPAQSFRDPGAFNTPRGFSRSEGPRRNTTRGQGIMSKYSKVKSLAHGGMSTAVNVVQDRSTGKVFVQKCIRVRQPKQMKRFRAELNTLQRIQKYGGSINLNNLIEFEASSRSPEAILILEYCDRGSLEDMMNSAATMGRPLPEAQAWNILLGVGMALGFLHKGVSRQGQIPNWDMTFHLDLRPCNIFLSSRGGQYGFPRVVLADFGCAVKASEVIRGKEDSFFQPCGSSFWYPPEGLGQTLIPHYGVKTDVWMLGATVHTFCGLLKIPNRLVLNSAVPCGLLYSASLNRSVAHLSHRVSAYRPAPEAIVATASVEFRRAVMRG